MNDRFTDSSGALIIGIIKQERKTINFKSVISKHVGGMTIFF